MNAIRHSRITLGAARQYRVLSLRPTLARSRQGPLNRTPTGLLPSLHHEVPTHSYSSGLGHAGAWLFSGGSNDQVVRRRDRQHITQLTTDYGPWVYVILFVIVFCETGLVVTPFLPGDSLLFAAGAVASTGSLNPFGLALTILIAAIAGDMVNYAIGARAGAWVTQRFPRVVRAEHIAKTNAFYQRYGGKAVVYARFVPIIRTFAPFVAGIGQMDARRFMRFNVLGACLWVGLLVPSGYYFANIPFVKQNFSTVILGIILVSQKPVNKRAPSARLMRMPRSRQQQPLTRQPRA